MFDMNRSDPELGGIKVMLKKVRLLLVLQLILGTLTPTGARAGVGMEEILFSDIPNVVTASRREESINDAPNTMYVFTAQEIRRRGFSISVGTAAGSRSHSTVRRNGFGSSIRRGQTSRSRICRSTRSSKPSSSDAATAGPVHRPAPSRWRPDREALRQGRRRG